MPVRPGNGFGGGLIVKVNAFERPFCPAPEAGLIVLMLAVPGLAINAAGTAAVTTFPRAAPVLSTGTVVASGLPFHWTTVFRTKPKPFSVNVRSAQVAPCAEVQAGICEGDRKVSAAPVLF